MIAGHVGKVPCCDADCAKVNGCRVGGYVCAECGLAFCPSTDGGLFADGEYICAECAGEVMEES